MIEHVWSVLCQSGAIDVEDGHVSMFDVVEDIHIFGDPEKFIRLPFRFEIFSLWARFDQNAGAKGKMRIIFCKPDGESNSQMTELPIDLTDHFFHRTRVLAQDLALKGSGIYKFIVEQQEERIDGWKTVTTIPMHVVFEASKNQPKPSL